MGADGKKPELTLYDVYKWLRTRERVSILSFVEDLVSCILPHKD